MSSTDSSLNDYELIPIKPLQDIKKEIQLIKENLKKEDSSSKILVKHMNLDLHLQKKLDNLIDAQNQLKNRISKIIDYFEDAIQDEEEERKTETQILLSKIDELSEQNKMLHNKIDLIIGHKEDIISRITDIKTQLPKVTPGSYMLRYRKTKNL